MSHLFIFALLCAVAQGAWAQRVVDLSTLTEEYEAQDGDVLTGYTKEKLYIVDGATVTFSNLTVLFQIYIRIRQPRDRKR